MECVRFWFELSREPKLINDRFIITFHIYNHCTDSVRVIMVKNVLIACLECLSVGRGGISSGQDIIFPRSLIIDPGKLISIEMKVQIIDSGVFTFYPALFYEIADEKRIVNAEKSVKFRIVSLSDLLGGEYIVEKYYEKEDYLRSMVENSLLREKRVYKLDKQGFRGV